jgi:hypothetical protein
MEDMRCNVRVDHSTRPGENGCVHGWRHGLSTWAGASWAKRSVAQPRVASRVDHGGSATVDALNVGCAACKSDLDAVHSNGLGGVCILLETHLGSSCVCVCARARVCVCVCLQT